jgi:hypothetical protein
MNNNSKKELDLSDYISNAVEFLDKGLIGKHEMCMKDLHLLKTSEPRRVVSKLIVSKLKTTKSIVRNFLDNESLN